MHENGVKTIKHFAAEIGVNRMTVSDIVSRRDLPTERMTHGHAKGLSPSTQLEVMRILGIEPAAAAS